MTNLIKKDFIVTFSNKQSIFTFLVLLPLLMFIVGSDDINMMFMYSTITFCFLSIRTSFSYEIKDRPQIFIQSLPVKKSDIVLSKYLSIIVNFLMASVFTFTYLFILSFIFKFSMEDLNLTTIMMSFSTVIILLSLSVPTDFMFTPKVSNFLNMFIYILFLNFFIIGSNSLVNFLGIFKDYRIGIALLTLGVYLLSIVLSVFLYKNKKFV